MTDYNELRAALTYGGLVPGEIVAGHLIRCKVEGDHGGKKSGAYRLFDDDFPVCVWWNWKTSTAGVWVDSNRPLTEAERHHQRERVEQARRERHAEQVAQWARNRDYVSALWAQGRALTDSDIVALYLEHRGLMVPHTDALRFHPALDYWHEDGHMTRHPAMLAAVTDASGNLVAVHRTYLDADGCKASVPTAKKLTRTTGPMAGASIKLGAPALRPDGRLGLGVAEGIETALAASLLAGIPVWPCVSAHGLEAFDPPPGVHHLYVMGDRDDSGTGQKAAAILAHRAAAAGLVARVLLPDAVGDWNDELVSRRAAV